MIIHQESSSSAGTLLAMSLTLVLAVVTLSLMALAYDRFTAPEALPIQRVDTSSAKVATVVILAVFGAAIPAAGLFINRLFNGEPRIGLISSLVIAAVCLVIYALVLSQINECNIDQGFPMRMNC